ncbi:hypothetical protein ACJMK2_005111 [Sinanodonta woodiana]|uniref:Transmembrane protein 129 n=1 Tax=Sinanodonta woodiana TaxID=1069815 RepID=A0ABD3VPD5_SINWO
MAEDVLTGLFTLFYSFFCTLLIAPPTEFISAGITVQNLLSSLLGSEDINFIYYHLRRTSATLVFHSIFPLVYYLCLALFQPQLKLLTPWNISLFWQLYLIISILILLSASLAVFYWSRNKWDNHPIARELTHLSSNEESWRAVASCINIEFRRIDKFTSGIPTGRRVIVTDSWVMKTSTYYIYIAHQNDIHLTISGSEDHSVSYESMTSVQYLNIDVISINQKLKPFTIRLNSLEYKELTDKLQSPVRNARNIVVRQSLSELFLEAFRDQVSQNPKFRLPPHMEVDTCIGCMQKESDIKLNKQCDDPETGACVQCYCRPMWCLECMGKWFSSRQDQQHPEIWLGNRCPCPTCRAAFCMLDVCFIEK